MRIAIVGAGAVGGYFGARMQAAGADVTFVARGAHLAALLERGLAIQSPRGDLRLARVAAVKDPSEVGPVDVALVTVKMYDLEALAPKLVPLVGPGTRIVPLQNGVEASDLLAQSVGAAHAASGTAYISATVVAPGTIRHAGLETLLFGEADDSPAPVLGELRDVARAAGIDATWSRHVGVEVWTKFVRLSAYSGVGAWARCAAGPLRDDPDLLETLQLAVREGVAVARARGVGLPDSAFEDAMKGLGAIPADAKSSMLEDLERGRPLELPWLSGAVVRLGREAGVEAPVHKMLAKALRPYMRGAPRQ
jgi:2-dehydropantoate 2-reductase